jgi:hypothetical protein
MNKGFQKFFFLLFCIFLFMQPALQDYDNLVDIELLSSDPAFGKFRLEEMASSHVTHPQIPHTNISSLILSLTTLFKDLLPNFSPISSVDPLRLILRC